MTLPMIMSCGMYYSVSGLRDLCHNVKSRDDNALTEAAEWLSRVVDIYDLEGYSIIPIPNHSGRAEYTLEILKRLKRIRNIRICDILVGAAHATQYDTKKAGAKLSVTDYGFKLIGDIPFNRAILFDNVIGSGNTYFSAMKTIKFETSLLTLAQTHSTAYYMNQWSICLINEMETP